MPSKNFTDDDIANVLLTVENNLEDHLWSDNGGKKLLNLNMKMIVTMKE
jgi:hypothetical protein